MATTFKSSVPGNGFEIDEHVLRVQRGFGPFKKWTTIPLRNIASAVKPTMRNQVNVVTNAGEKITLVTTHPQDAINALFGGNR